jgi:predicted TPR repeat methyltransferase
MLTAYTAEEAPPRAADDYVREEFDRFAESFDDKLSSLNYRAPQLVGEAVARHHSAPDGSLVVLDVGCGTGLGGLLLRPYAARLSGVDLSPEMLARARDRGVYDDLAEMELVAYLGGHPRAFDLVTVIDTFVYFGDLAPPLAACAAALRPGGSLAFTVEAAPEPQTTFRLDRSGRYVHGREYVESCLDRAGFGRREIDSVALREEGGQPVGGLLVWAGL